MITENLKVSISRKLVQQGKEVEPSLAKKEKKEKKKKRKSDAFFNELSQLKELHSKISSYSCNYDDVIRRIS